MKEDEEEIIEGEGIEGDRRRQEGKGGEKRREKEKNRR